MNEVVRLVETMAHDIEYMHEALKQIAAMENAPNIADQPVLQEAVRVAKRALELVGGAA